MYARYLLDHMRRSVLQLSLAYNRNHASLAYAKPKPKPKPKPNLSSARLVICTQSESAFMVAELFSSS